MNRLIYSLAFSLPVVACTTTGTLETLEVSEHEAATRVKQKLAVRDFFIATYSSLNKKAKNRSIAKGMAVSIGRKNNECLILTNAHITKGKRYFKLSPWAWQKKESLIVIDASLVFESQDRDIAILKFSPNSKVTCKPASINPNFNESLIGLDVTTYGQPNPFHGLRSYGKILGAMPIKQKTYLVSNMFTTPGFSGGGVYNNSQQLVGLSIGRATSNEQKKLSQGLAYIIPSREILESVRKFIDE